MSGEHFFPAILKVIAHEAPEVAAQLGELGLLRTNVAIKRLTRLKAASVRDKDAALGVALTRLGLLLALILQPLLLELQLKGGLFFCQTCLLRLFELALVLNAFLGRIALGALLFRLDGGLCKGEKWRREVNVER